MTITDDLSALSEHILLIAFVINPVLISWLEPQLGFPLAYLLLFNEFEFEYLHNVLFTLIFMFLHLESVDLRHSEHVIYILSYILGKMKAMTRN